MKALFFAAMAALICTAQPAVAAGWGYGPLLQAQSQRFQPRPGPAQRDQRDMQRGERPDRGGRAPNRLTDEERRELRRDLDRANREIYRRNRQR